MLTMTTRLRLVIEDPRQLLSGCVTDYAVEQLRLNGNDPASVVVPVSTATPIRRAFERRAPSTQVTHCWYLGSSPGRSPSFSPARWHSPGA